MAEARYDSYNNWVFMNCWLEHPMKLSSTLVCDGQDRVGFLKVRTFDGVTQFGS